MVDVTRDKTEQVMVRLTPETYEALRAESDREERTVAQTVRLAIRRYLGEERP